MKYEVESGVIVPDETTSMDRNILQVNKTPGRCVYAAYPGFSFEADEV